MLCEFSFYEPHISQNNSTTNQTYLNTTTMVFKSSTNILFKSNSTNIDLGSDLKNKIKTPKFITYFLIFWIVSLIMEEIRQVIYRFKQNF